MKLRPALALALALARALLHVFLLLLSQVQPANGYVYHTSFDVPSAVPDGSVRRLGETVVALARALAADLAAEPAAAAAGRFSLAHMPRGAIALGTVGDLMMEGAEL